MSDTDTSHNGKVDAFELIAALATFTAGKAEDKARLVFQVIDRDGSNTLTKSEVHKQLRALSLVLFTPLTQPLQCAKGVDIQQESRQGRCAHQNDGRRYAEIVG